MASDAAALPQRDGDDDDGSFKRQPINGDTEMTTDDTMPHLYAQSTCDSIDGDDDDDFRLDRLPELVKANKKNYGGHVSNRSDSAYGSTIALNTPPQQQAAPPAGSISSFAQFRPSSTAKADAVQDEPSVIAVAEGMPPGGGDDDPDGERKSSASRRARKYLRKRCASAARSCCARETWLNRLPILRWLPRYSRRDASGDVISGITVGLTVVPQSLAYAAIAGLPLQYGLYSSFMGCFVYCILGTSKDVAMGTAALTSLLTASVITKLQPFSPQYAVCVCFLVGVIQLLLGVLRLGILIDFVSTPVLKGFICSGSLIIAAEQLKNLLGIKSRRGAFYITIYDACKNIVHANIYDVIVAAISFVILVGLKHLTWPLVCRVFGIRMPAKKPTLKKSSRASNRIADGVVSTAVPRPANNKPKSLRYLKLLRFTIRIVSLCRNALVVVLASVAAYIMLANNINVITLSEKVPPGLPPLRPPPFSFPETNKTAVDLIETAGGGIGILAVLSLLITVSVGKALGARNGYYIDPTQEFIAVGLANIASSFVSSYPITTSFSRASLNSDSGVRTPAGGVVTGGLVILALSLLSPYFSYIPRAALGAVIVCAVLPLFESDVFMHTWRVNRLDLIPLLSTMLGAFMLGSEYGIIIGVAVSLVVLLYANARPNIEVANSGVPAQAATRSLPEEDEKFPDFPSPVRANDDDSAKDDDIAMVAPYGALYFPSADYLRDLLNDQHLPPRKSPKNNDSNSSMVQKVVIVDASHVTQCDYTAICALRDALNALARRRVHVAFVALRSRLQQKLLAAGVKNCDAFSLHDSLQEARASILRQRRSLLLQNAVHQRVSIAVADTSGIVVLIAEQPYTPEDRVEQQDDAAAEGYDRESVAEFVPTNGGTDTTEADPQQGDSEVGQDATIPLASVFVVPVEYHAAAECRRNS